MKRTLIYLATFWVIALNNSKIPERLLTYKIFCIFRLPRQVRYIEICIVIIMSIIVFLSTNDKFLRKIIWLLIFFMISALIGIIIHPTLIADQLQGIYIYILPILIFIFSAFLKINKEDILFITKFYSLYLLINIFIGLIFDLPLYGSAGDGIHGLYSDAHVFGTFLAILSCVFFYSYLKTKKLKSLLTSFSLVLFSFLPSNEKMIIFNLITIFLLFIFEYVKFNFKKKLEYSIILLLVIAFGFNLYSSLLIQYFPIGEGGIRLEDVINFGINNVGFITGWPLAVNSILISPLSFLFGLGSANYGGIAAARLLISGGVSNNLISGKFYDQIVSGAGVAGAFVNQTNTWTTLLAEYGIIGFFIFIIILIKLVSAVKKTNMTNNYDNIIKISFFIFFASIIYQGFFTPYTNWGEPILIYPMMILLGYLYNCKIENQKSTKILTTG